MNMNFMRIDQVVISGDGFYQSMAYHAYQSLAWPDFWMQCVWCLLSIGLGYVLRQRLLLKLANRGAGRWITSAVMAMGPAVVAVASMATGLSLGGLWGWTAYDLLVLWKVQSLTLWVLGIRFAGWFFRHVLQPHEVLRIFLHLIEWGVVVGVVFTFLGLFQPVTTYILGIEFAMGQQVFKGANIVTGLLMGVVALTVAGQLADLVDRLLRRFVRRQTIQGNDALILTRLFSTGIFALTLVGVLISSGVNVTTVTAFAGALGIGLGFGLQEFVVNFVSGLYVLLERALKVGDYVTIGNITGRVVQMSSRALVVRDSVGTESLIPNSSVIKGVLQNHTLSNDDFRVSFQLKIADVADYPHAKEVILQTLNTFPRVLPEPSASVLLTAVTSNEVVLETSFWINDLRNGQKSLVSDLMYAICMRFRAEGVPMAPMSMSMPGTLVQPATPKPASAMA